MNERQTYALAHPASDRTGVHDPQLRRVRRHPRGFNVASILAVDR